MEQWPKRIMAAAMGAILYVAMASSQGGAEPAVLQDAIVQDLVQLRFATSTRLHRPGDPIHVGIIASQDEIVSVMLAAGWQRPVPVTLRSSAKIGGSVTLHHAYYNAPVSTLIYLGCRQDLVFKI